MDADEAKVRIRRALDTWAKNQAQQAREDAPRTKGGRRRTRRTPQARPGDEPGTGEDTTQTTLPLEAPPVYHEKREDKNMSTTTAVALNHSTPLAGDYLPPVDPKAVEQAMLIGDLSQMTDEQRIAYYVATCRSLGLNPLTKPFQALKADDGKLTLYPDKGCAEQLRKLHKVSVKVLGREILDGLYIITVQATTPDGREEEAQGIVPLVKAKGTWESTQGGKRYFKASVDATGEEIMLPLSATERATAMMRAETKAKRRVTLAICGLGLPDYEPDTESVAHPMALNLQGTPRLEREGTSSPKVELFGEERSPVEQQIDALLTEACLGPEEQAAWWAKMDAKYPGRELTSLAMLRDKLQEEFNKRREQAEQAERFDTATGEVTDDETTA